jgi:DNA-directed RNA polymerase specialized sigma24 family protein
MGDDAELFARAEHDVAAFEVLYRRHVRRVAAYAAGRCSSADDVADVVAQTFVRLLAAAGRFDPARGEPEAFVLGIAANVVRDLHRLTTRQRALDARMSAAERPTTPPASTPPSTPPGPHRPPGGRSTRCHPARAMCSGSSPREPRPARLRPYSASRPARPGSGCRGPATGSGPGWPPTRRSIDDHATG